MSDVAREAVESLQKAKFEENTKEEKELLRKGLNTSGKKALYDYFKRYINYNYKYTETQLEIINKLLFSTNEIKQITNNIKDTIKYLQSEGFEEYTWKKFEIYSLLCFKKEQDKAKTAVDTKKNGEKTSDLRENEQNISHYIFSLLLNKKRRTATEVLAKYLLKKFTINTIRDDDKSEMWIYHKGINVPNGRTHLKEFIRKILNKGYTSTLANEVILKVEADTYIDPTDFFVEEDINLICLENGILKIKERELIPFSEKYRFFNKLPLKYDPKAECPGIKKFFKTVLKHEEDINIIQELFGFLLVRDYVYEVAFMWLGFGRNGKGKSSELIKRFVGIINCANLSLSTLEKSNFALSELFGKLANLSADLSKTELRETGNFKSLTGRDLITADRKFKRPISFISYAKQIFCANELPETRDHSDGFFDRWIILDFPYKFVDNPDPNKKHHKQKDAKIIDKISTSSEMSGLLNWSLEGLNRLNEQNKFSYSQTTEEVKRKWLRKSSSINAFILDHVEYKFDASCPKSELRQFYSYYCQKHKIPPVTDKKIAYALSSQVGAGETRIDGVRCWQGINLVNLDDGLEVLKKSRQST